VIKVDWETTSIPVSYQGPMILGVGAFLKNTVTALTDGRALVSMNLGDLDKVETITAFDSTVDRIISEAGGAPAIIAHDLHPNFYTTRFAESCAVKTLAVQHHHAHVAAVMAENNTMEPVLGLALDGFGIGPNDESWGGELLRVDAGGYERLGNLRLLKQPGGDVAARQPWRMGAAVLHALGRDHEIEERFSTMDGAKTVTQMLAKDLNSPETSSCGRLFDAACGLLGVKLIASYEGEAPMALETLANSPTVDPNGWALKDGVLDLMPVMAKLPGMDAEAGANLFHGTLAAALQAWTLEAVEKCGLMTVALSGGCMFNTVVRDLLTSALQEKGVTVLFTKATNPGDASISLGQTWVAAMQQERRN